MDAVAAEPKANLKFTHLVGRSWRAFKAQPWPLVHASIVCACFYFFLNLPSQFLAIEINKGGPPPQNFLFLFSPLAIALLLTTPILIGQAYIALQTIRGRATSWSDIFLGFKTYPSVLSTTLYFTICFTARFLLLFIPGIAYLSARWPVFFMILDSELGFSGRFRNAKQLTQGRCWKLFIFIALYYVVSVGPYIAIDSFVAAPFLLSGGSEITYLLIQFILSFIYSTPIMILSLLFFAAAYDELVQARSLALDTPKENDTPDPREDFELA